MSKPQDPLEITPTLLLRAYAAGVFPMAESARATSLFWVDPKQRGILPLDALHVSASLRRTIRRGRFRVGIDEDFSATLDGCAGREETWINPEIRDLFITLHRMGYAHSIEVYDDQGLAGGLYGVRLGAAFFGESMFSYRPDASKIALVWLVARLRAGGFTLLDTQFVTDHLARLGAVEVSRDTYHEMLDAALMRTAQFWELPVDASSASVLQLSTQTS
ncbi:leucyl/phenylalanyl-tRNA--protein transferase [Paroceanicella profunda]|uniref:Leucyl/phenylalanyl-tRNA--protein transferase n=1 Tax=Paroceanicella profunda TaxID=2579971 RepID=A0A5B8G4A2_9RHOB|nr:leucyl/phenylalanyl-tRNA--protein transferase [Paroceanicella profunda]QDL93723.1 leucyl/phenylalanyl-tRNA--protein transferase [Paroceanicella profunda]